jgi:hypothetical protein
MLHAVHSLQLCFMLAVPSVASLYMLHAAMLHAAGAGFTSRFSRLLL